MHVNALLTMILLMAGDDLVLLVMMMMMMQMMMFPTEIRSKILIQIVTKSLCFGGVLEKRAKSARSRRVLHLRVKCASEHPTSSLYSTPRNDISDHCTALYYPSSPLVNTPARKCCKISRPTKALARVRTAARIVLEKPPTSIVTREIRALEGPLWMPRTSPSIPTTCELFTRS